MNLNDPLSSARHHSTPGPSLGQTVRPHATVYPLSLTLEELCTGTTHTYRITRQLINEHSVKQLVEIEVLPGWRQGVSVRFEGYGNEGRVEGPNPGEMHIQADDIMFVVVETAHDRFVRAPAPQPTNTHPQTNGSRAAPNGAPNGHGPASNANVGGDGDLILRQPLQVRKGEREVIVLGVDGKDVVVPMPTAVRRGHTGETRVRGAGMPVRVRGVVERRGDLLVRWEIV